MTQFFQFTPSSVAPYQFQPVLDGETYTVTVTWNVFGQRYYVNVQNQDGDLIVSIPLVGSLDAGVIASISWAAGVVTATTYAPHLLAIGETLNLRISGCMPEIYNGIVSVLVTGAQTFRYALSEDPGSATRLGAYSYGIDLIAGYFAASTMIIRSSTLIFEVDP